MTPLSVGAECCFTGFNVQRRSTLVGNAPRADDDVVEAELRERVPAHPADPWAAHDHPPRVDERDDRRAVLDPEAVETLVEADPLVAVAQRTGAPEQVEDLLVGEERPVHPVEEAAEEPVRIGEVRVPTGDPAVTARARVAGCDVALRGPHLHADSELAPAFEERL